MTAPLLLVLTFANGMGLAMRWPVFAAIVPELVSRHQLSAALALNGIAMNASRIIGPHPGRRADRRRRQRIRVHAERAAVGGGGVCHHALAARAQGQRRCPVNAFWAAIRVGVQHVRQSAACTRCC